MRFGAIIIEVYLQCEFHGNQGLCKWKISDEEGGLIEALAVFAVLAVRDL
jgi:hypothetical protein